MTMNTSQLSKFVPILPILTVVALAGCQPKQEQKATTEKVDIPLIHAKVVPVKLPKQKVCLEDGCTSYDLQTVETNQKWIDEYFVNRMKKAEPNAFANLTDQPVKAPADGAAQNESSTYVRFVSQNYNLATFAIQSYSYSVGAAHGMSHQEFVNFDLTNKKHITVNELLKPDMNTKLRDELYAANQNWLEEHNIKKEQLQVSDNYYYGVNGIVFVYPLYELASYAEGMSELTLPYYAAKEFVKAEYLPSLPKDAV
ncbi:RsiV family protein [Acinetobacter vivianii]|uniref:RsiV family protein n=1 Tax=Acinetobacter vivianii TaxID=1776742 RepID=UPI002DB9AC97|nr:RsiV family protein [Acinetobacter vivianii]MEB6480173.1 RsiV family protein [Acinetobacter vivianii]MEB6658620.1 RsiV family protein [Acinetobacter vivianii]